MIDRSVPSITRGNPRHVNSFKEQERYGVKGVDLYPFYYLRGTLSLTFLIYSILFINPVINHVSVMTNSQVACLNVL